MPNKKKKGEPVPLPGNISQNVLYKTKATPKIRYPKTHNYNKRFERCEGKHLLCKNYIKL